MQEKNKSGGGMTSNFLSIHRELFLLSKILEGPEFNQNLSPFLQYAAGEERGKVHALSRWSQVALNRKLLDGAP